MDPLARSFTCTSGTFSSSSSLWATRVPYFPSLSEDLHPFMIPSFSPAPRSSYTPPGSQCTYYVLSGWNRRPPIAWIYMQFCAANIGVSINSLRVIISLNSTRFCGSRVPEPDQSRSRGSVLDPLQDIRSIYGPSILCCRNCNIPRLPHHVSRVGSHPRFNRRSREESAVGPSAVLVDKWGTIFGSALLTATLEGSAGASVLDVPVWSVTVRL